MIFVSHSSIDKAFVRFFAAELEACGYQCWVDEKKLDAGDRLSPVIEAAIRAAENVLVFVSRSSAGSTWVQREITAASALENVTRKHSLIPCMLGEITDGELSESLRDTLYVDFRQPEIYDKQAERLFRALAGDGESARLPAFDADRSAQLIPQAAAPEVRDWIVRFLVDVVSRRADATERYWIYITVAELGTLAKFGWFSAALDKENGFARKGVIEALGILQEKMAAKVGSATFFPSSSIRAIGLAPRPSGSRPRTRP